MSLRVLIAEDSTIFADVLLEILGSEAGVEVVALADNGVDAVELCQLHRPDIVLMDIHMPRLDGLTATEEIMATCPTPILVITADPHRGGVDLSFRALSAGALDLMPKPDRLPFPDADRRRLMRKIRLLSQIPVVRHVRGRRRPAHTPVTIPFKSQASSLHRPPVVGIVASTGGPRALARICTDLPEDFPGSLVIVQHITDGFSRHLARWLDKHCSLSVSEARDGQSLETGTAYIAPTGLHLSIDSDLRLVVSEGPAVGGHRPSGDRLLESLARHAPSHTIGLVLSGMGDDGTAGITALFQAGCPTIAQDESTSVVFGMPHSAISCGVIHRTLPDSRIAAALVQEVARINAAQSSSHEGGDR